MDKHLNLFKFFNEKLSVEHIENNLSRALVLCLQNDKDGAYNDYQLEV